MKKQIKLMQGNNLELLKQLPDNSIDSVITDPPYGLGKERDMNIILKDWIEKGYSEIEGTGFMGKEWDVYVPQPQFWKEIYRVLKPGGHILSFFGTRTYDIGTMAIRMAGFEIRDQIMWLYGSGFPKSHNIGKAVDKIQGNEREVVGDIIYADGTKSRKTSQSFQAGGNGDIIGDTIKTKGNSQYEGWGTALKPANEPICVARKPLSEKSVAENVLKWGTGGINVDGCRVGNEIMKEQIRNNDGGMFMNKNKAILPEHEGRFPANLILECICDEVIKGEKGEPRISNKKGGSPIFGSELSVDYKGKWPNDKGDTHTNPNCPCYLLDEQSGESKSRSKYPEPDISSMSMTYYDGKEDENGVVKGLKKEQTKEGFTDKGGASRFFYQAKVSKAERNMGLDGFEDKKLHNINQLDDRLRSDGTLRETPIHKNNHPTVKPVNLMTYLCRLITPEGGIVLDAFMGSGSTGIAARLEGFNFIGMEMDSDYFKIAESRIENYEKYRKFIK